MAEGKEPRSKRRGTSKPAGRGKTGEQKGTTTPRGKPEPKQEPSETTEVRPAEETPDEAPASTDATQEKQEEQPETADVGATPPSGDPSDQPPVAEEGAEEPPKQAAKQPAEEAKERQDYDVVLAAIQEKETRLQSDLDTLRQRVTDLGKAAARQEAAQEKAVKQEQVEALQAELATLQQRVTNLGEATARQETVQQETARQEQVQALQSDLDTLRQRVTDLGETAVRQEAAQQETARQEQVNALQSELATLQQRMTDLGEATARQETAQQETARQEQVDALQRELDTLRQRVTDLGETAARQEAVWQEAARQEQVQALQSDLSTLRQRVTDLDETVDRLEAVRQEAIRQEAARKEQQRKQEAAAKSAEPEHTAASLELRLKNFPISFFAMILGLSGFTIAVQRAEMILKFPPFHISPVILGFTVLLFLVILGIYTFKLIKFPADVVAEINHPVRLSFFPTISISLLLFSIATFKMSPPLSLGLWVVGTILHAVFSLYIISIWIQHPKFQMQHFNAAWFIPVVGNIIIPVAGAEHGFHQISWLFFSVGFVFWIVLMTLLFNRLIFHQPLPARLIPTLFIMIAPPAVGFIAYVKVNHEQMDNFATVLYYFALFLFVLLVVQFNLFSRLRFFLSWWAYSFPIAAMTIATLFRVKLIREERLHAKYLMEGPLPALLQTPEGQELRTYFVERLHIIPAASHYSLLQLNTLEVLSFILLGAITLVILMLLFKTVLAIRAGEICVEEG
jgi:tellurite resistance protein